MTRLPKLSTAQFGIIPAFFCCMKEVRLVALLNQAREIEP